VAIHKAKQEYRVTGTAKVPGLIAVNETTHAFSETQAIRFIEKRLEAEHRRVKIFWHGDPSAALTQPAPEPVVSRPTPVRAGMGRPTTMRRAPHQLGLGFA
jgi:hypothetical protein